VTLPYDLSQRDAWPLHVVARAVSELCGVGGVGEAVVEVRRVRRRRGRV
jgi:hypothetical protein